MYSIASPPVVTPVKTLSPQDAEPLVDKCLEERGFPMDNGGGWSVPDAQYQAFQESEYICHVSYPPEPRTLRPLTNDQKHKWYEYVVNTEIPCLEAEGYEVARPPSWETFLAGFYSDLYTPYEEVWNEVPQSKQTPAYQDYLNKKCPQEPPWEVLWG